MTIDEKIKEAAEGQSMRLTSSLIDADTRARIFTNGANFLKSEMLADMQKLAEALGRALKPDVEYESLIAKEIVEKALAEFNAKYKGKK